MESYNELRDLKKWIKAEEDRARYAIMAKQLEEIISLVYNCEVLVCEFSKEGCRIRINGQSLYKFYEKNQAKIERIRDLIEAFIDSGPFDDEQFMLHLHKLIK
jgi:hypothetical protein